MMKKFTLFLLLTAAAVLSAAVAEVELSYRKVTLENRFFTLEFLPDSLGRLDQIRLKPSDKCLLLPRTLTRVSVDPLYGFYRNNSFGCGENFWKNYVASRDGKSRVSRPDARSIIFENKWYGGLAVDVKRKVTLAPNETLFFCEAEVFNRDRKKDFFLAPWYAFSPADADSTRLLIPAKGGAKSHTLGNTKFVERDLITDGPSGLYAPARNWVATVYPAEKCALAIIVPPEEFFPDGAFYTWHGKEGTLSYRSMEAVLNKSLLAPQAKRKFSCIFAVFYGITDIKDIAGTTAVDAGSVNGRLILTLSPARRVPAGRITIYVKGDGAEKSAEISTTELFAGRKYGFAFDMQCGKISKITGSLPDGSTFDLLI